MSADFSPDSWRGGDCPTSESAEARATEFLPPIGRGVTSPSVYRVGGISYLDVPSVDPGKSAAFYHEVLGWKVEERPGAWSFEDWTGHVIGHFLRDRAGSGDAGILPYTYVESVDAVLTRVVAANGQIVRAPYSMGELWIATFRDPSSNLMGIWQRGPR